MSIRTKSHVVTPAVAGAAAPGAGVRPRRGPAVPAASPGCCESLSARPLTVTRRRRMPAVPPVSFACAARGGAGEGKRHCGARCAHDRAFSDSPSQIKSEIVALPPQRATCTRGAALSFRAVLRGSRACTRRYVNSFIRSICDTISVTRTPKFSSMTTTSPLAMSLWFTRMSTGSPGELVQLDDRALADPQDVLDPLPRPAQLDGHLHVHVHEKTDVSLLPAHGTGCRLANWTGWTFGGAMAGALRRAAECLAEGLLEARLPAAGGAAAAAAPRPRRPRRRRLRECGRRVRPHRSPRPGRGSPWPATGRTPRSAWRSGTPRWRPGSPR